MQTEYLLLTGVTGFLGHYVLAELLRRDRPCVAVLRAPDTDRPRLIKMLADIGCDADNHLKSGRLVVVAGELTAMPDLQGIRIQAIVHIAAATNFRTNAQGDPHRSNVIGTESLLGWAANRGIQELHYVSSAYSCGRTTDPVAEELHDGPRGFHNDYEKSKHEAEHLCARWALRTNASLMLYRPSVIVGEFSSGRSTRFAGFYLSARSTEFLSRSFEHDSDEIRQNIPLRIKGRAQDCQNIVPVDYVASMIAGAVAEPSAHGRVYHLTHPSPPSNQHIKSAFEAYFRIGGGRFVAPEDFSLADLSEHEQRFYEISRSIEHYFVDTPTFLRSHTESLEKRLSIACPSYEAIDLARLIAYAQSASWGRESTSRRSTPCCTAYFERFLPGRMEQSQVARQTAVTANVRFIIEDDPGREWVCRFDRGRLIAVHQGPNGVREDFGYRSNREVFWEAIAGKVHPQEVFLSGRAEVFGDVERALKMAMILHEFNKEHPCDETILWEYEASP